jgi:hypothetical protein
LRLKNTARTWVFRLSAAGNLAIIDGNTSAFPLLITAGAPSGSLSIGGSGFVSFGALRLVGRTATAADPTTTELPTDKDVGIHKNTSSGSVFLAYNDGGAIKKVELT